jgi:hypothetical protein
MPLYVRNAGYSQGMGDSVNRMNKLTNDIELHGGRLCFQASGPFGGKFYFPDGTDCQMPATAKKMIEAGELIPNEDGLFGGDSQTFEIK